LWWAIKKERNLQLLRASELGDAGKARELLSVRKHKELIADVNIKSLDDFTPLHHAVSENHFDVVKLLLARGAFIDPVTTFSSTPLHLACYRGKKEIIKLLVEKGANINAKDGDGNTAAHILSSQGSLQILKWLLEQKPDLTLKNNYGETASEVVANVEARALFLQHKKEESGSYSRTMLTNNMILHNNRADMIKSIMFKGKLLPSQSVDAQEDFIEKKQIPIKENKRRLVKIIEIAKENAKLAEALDDETYNKKNTGIGEEAKGSMNVKAEEKASPESFDLIMQLGKGSFGEVYLVQHRTTGKLYAMKIMDKNRFMSNNLLKYAMAERNVLCYTKHPFIVGLDYAFQTAKRLFLLLEYCPG
jgi:protein-serine/threonine kinase